MELRVLDLDGSISLQENLIGSYGPELIPLRHWGPQVRLACGLGRFRRFEKQLADIGPGPEGGVTLYGSGDFHHVTLALVRQLTEPFHLLVVDNHPDWMRGVPFLHCGTWLYHAARLPLVRRIFHVGGNVDFDNYYRWLAPWELLTSGKIVVFPALRSYQRGSWSKISHRAVRAKRDTLADVNRLEELLLPYRQELAEAPLYISLDKDVMVPNAAIVNWDSGHLTLGEVQTILETFLHFCGNRMAGVDITGDWSPVHVRGLLRRTMHWTEHPRLRVDPSQATSQNEWTNRALLAHLEDLNRNVEIRNPKQIQNAKTKSLNRQSLGFSS